MGCQIYLSRLALCDMGIDLGGCEVGMAQKLLNNPQVGATIEEMGSKAMAHHVGEYPFTKSCRYGIS